MASLASQEGSSLLCSRLLLSRTYLLYSKPKRKSQSVYKYQVLKSKKTNIANILSNLSLARHTNLDS